MRIPIAILIILLLSASVSATEQIDELLIYNGQTVKLNWDVPLEAYFTEDRPRPVSNNHGTRICVSTQSFGRER